VTRTSHPCPLPVEGRGRPFRPSCIDRTRSIALGIASLVLVLARGLSAATYYVDCQGGRDSNDGLGPLTAWRTIERANQQTYGPGDAIVLRRNCVWHGSGFKANGNGSIAAPITLADYGDVQLHLPIT